MRYIKKDNYKEVQEELTKTKDYNCDKSKEYIGNTYEHSCAYCEGRPEATSSFHIEHFYEKSDNPQFKTDIRNLHYSCPDCNRNKENFKYIRPILSPNFYLKCIDDEAEIKCGKTCMKKCKNKKHTCHLSCYEICPNDWKRCKCNWEECTKESISDQLTYFGHMLFAKTAKAKNTIDLFDLNNQMHRGRSARGYLVNERLNVYCHFAERIEKVYKYLQIIHTCPKISSELWELINNEMKNITLELKGEKQLPYTQMLIDNFAVSIIQLLHIIKKMKEH